MIVPEWYLLHPIAVHFPIALLAAGLAAACLHLYRGKGDWSGEAATWLLWLGTAAAWAAMGLGLLAERTVPHIPPAWETMADHETLAYWTVGLFTLLSAWRFWMRRRKAAPNRGMRTAFLALWIAAVGVLFATGADMRNTEAIPVYFHRRFQTGKMKSAG